MEPPRRFAFEAAVLGFAAGPQGAIAVALADGAVRLISCRSAEEAVVQAHEGPVLQLAYHPASGGFLSAGEDGRVCRISPTGACDEALRFGSKWVENLIIDAVSGCCAVTAGRELHLLSPELEPLRSRALPSAPGALGLDMRRRRIAVPHYGGVSLVPWLAGDEEGQAMWKGSHLAAAISPDGRWLATGMQENAVHVWPLKGGEDLGMRGYRTKPRSLAWTADSKLLLSSGLDSVVAWRFDGRDPPGRSPLILGWADGGIATRVAVHPTAPAAAVGFDNGAVLFADLGERRVVTLEDPGISGVAALGWSDDGLRLMIGRQDGAGVVYDIAS